MVGETAERAILLALLLALLLDPSGLGVPPHVGASVSGGDVQQGDPLKGRTLSQVQGNAITLEENRPSLVIRMK